MVLFGHTHSSLLFAPVAPVTAPAGHAVQPRASPVSSLKKFLGHSLHVPCAPEPKNRSLHTQDPPYRSVVSGQKHWPANVAPVPSVELPGGHSVHPSASPTSPLYVPSGHFPHVPSRPDPKYPSTHTQAPPSKTMFDGQMHCDMLVDSVVRVYAPSGQGVHPSASPGESLNVLSGQGEQAPSPSLPAP